MLDSGLLPGLEYVRVLTPPSLEYVREWSAAPCSSLPCLLQSRNAARFRAQLRPVGVGTGPFGCAAGEARRVARRRSESRARADAAVRAAHAHTHARAHAFTHAQTHAFTHTRTHTRTCERPHAHTRAHTHTGAFRQAGKAVKVTTTRRHMHRAPHTRARPRLARRLIPILRCAAADARRRRGGDGARLRALHAARVRRAAPALRRQR
jgi:hypothetical protein